jgi:DNA-binding SARP family transcriptional activator/TolB-like protein
MLTLHTLGTLELKAADGHALLSVLAQPKRLALLIYLATASPGGFQRRDKLLALFWPELDEEHARNSLSQALSYLRRSLGRDALTTRGSEEVGVDPAQLQCDVVLFEEALRAGRKQEALALYRGDFLESFHLSNAPAFEEWVRVQRERISRTYAQALESFAREREENGDSRGAVEAWRRLSGHDPYSSRIALHLMRALEAAGDRAGALQHAQVYRTLLQQEFGADPDPEIAALAEFLRRGPSNGVLSEQPGTTAPEPDPTAPGRRTPKAPSQIRSFPLNATREPALAAELATADQVPQPTRADPVPRAVFGKWTVGAVTATLAALLVVWSFSRSESRPGAASASTRIAVFPFTVLGSDEFGYLGEGMVHLLSAKLDGAGALQSVDPDAILGQVPEHGRLDREQGHVLARRLGAGSFVLGTVLKVGNKLGLEASVYDREGVLMTTAQVIVEDETKILDRVDQLAARILAAQSSGPGARLTQLATVTTISLPALKAYLTGEGHLRARRHNSAAEAFQQALALDSTFALAAYRLSIALDWIGSKDLSRSAVEHARRHSARLPLPDRLLVDALLAHHMLAPAEAKLLYRKALGLQPDAVEAWHGLAEVEFHHNPLLGHDAALSRTSFERVLALDPAHQSAPLHLAWLALSAGDRPTFDAMLPRILRESPGDSLRWLHLRAFGFGDRVAQERFALVYGTLGEAELYGLAHELFIRAQDFPDAERLSRLLVISSRSPEYRVSGHLLLAWLAMVQGKLRTAEHEIAAVALLDLPAALEYRALFAAAPFVPIPDVRVRAIRDSLAAWSGTTVENPHLPLYTGMHPEVREYLLGLLSARLQDSSAVLRHAVSLRSRPSSTAGVPHSGSLRATAIRARLAATKGDAAAALALLEQTAGGKLPDQPFATFNYFERELRPALLRDLGRDGEALGWYSAAPWLGSVYWEETAWDLIHSGPFAFQQGLILERMGRRNEAAAQYMHFVELWKDADPELQPMRADAIRRLRRLRVVAPSPQ